MSDALRLTLVRHAKSSWRFASLDDFHRPLNARGLRDLVHAPALVAACVPVPDQVLSSDAVRAVQTCEAIADAFGLDAARVQLSRALYMASAGSMRAILAALGHEIRHVLLVGHNPGLTDLYNELVDTPLDNLPTFAVAPLRLEIPAWNALAPGCGRCERVLRPKEMLRDG